MNQNGLFLPDHKRLLSIATWAQIGAWVMLAGHILYASVTFIQFQSSPSFHISYSREIQSLSLVADIAMLVLKGAIYYVVLRAVSLGLKIIVETSINSYNQQDGE